MDIISRIKQFIEYKEISERKFCAISGLSNGFLNKVKDIGSEKARKILYAFPEINPEWLISGEGAMLRNAEDRKLSVDIENSPIHSSGNVVIGDGFYLRSHHSNEELIGIIRHQNEQIAQQNLLISKLQDQLTDQVNRNKEVTDKLLTLLMDKNA